MGVDINGGDIQVGDSVVFAKGGKHKLHKGRIRAINAKTVTVVIDEEVIKWEPSVSKYLKTGVKEALFYRAPEDVVVVGRWI